MKLSFWDKIRIGFHYLIQGMISGDKVIKSGTGDDSVPIGGIEQQQEQQSVYKDLLRGEITQEVKELRHQMYFVERKSHEYEYNGGGHAKKRNNIFGYTGNVENSDGYPIKLVQENRQIIHGLGQSGVHIVGDEVIIDEELQKSYNTSDGINAEYTVHVERDYYPRFRIERYATKLVVKNVDETHAIVDFYLPQYRQQFNNITKLLQAELDRIYQGDVRSDLVQFDKVWFKTSGCYGADDMILFEYDDAKFDNIIKFDGSYVLRFYCHILTNGKDEIDEVYNEEMARKYSNKEAREGAMIDFDAMAAIKAKEELDVSEDLELLNKLRDKDDKEKDEATNE